MNKQQTNADRHTDRARPGLFSRLPLSFFTLLFSFFLLSAAAVLADTAWWDGGGANNNFNNRTNWDATAGGSGDPATAPVNAADTATFNVTAQNAASVTVNLSAPLSVSGLVFNTTGTTTFTNGANRAITVGTAGITINSGAGAVTFGTTTANQQETFTLSGSQTWKNDSANTLTLNANNTIGGAYVLTIDGVGNITANGIISTLTGLTKNGSGTNTLGAINTFTGLTTVNAGELQWGVANTLSSGDLTINNGGTVNLVSYADTVGTVTLNAGGIIKGTTGRLTTSASGMTSTGGTIDSSFTTGGVTLGGTLTYNSSGSSETTLLTYGVLAGGASRTYTINNGVNAIDFDIQGTLSGTTALTKGGAGTMRIGGTAANNLATATTAVQDGELSLNNSSGGNVIGSGTVTIGDSTGSAGSAILRYSGYNDQIQNSAITINSDGLLDLNGKTETTSGALTINAAGQVTVGSGGSLTVGALTVNGSLTTGGGNLTGTTLAMTGGSINAGSGTYNLGGGVTGNSSATLAAITAGKLDLGAATRTFTIADDATADPDMEITAAVTNGTLAKAGAGQLQLSGSTSNTATFTISAGTLYLNKSDTANAIGTGGVSVVGATVQYAAAAGSDQINDAAPVTLANGAGVATLDLNGKSDTIGSLTFGGASGTATSQGAVTTGAGTLILGGNVTYTNNGNPLGATISGNLNLGGATRTFSIANSTATNIELNISAAVASGGLTKTGAGCLALSGVNTYTGDTLVSAGTQIVAVAGSILNSPNVTVSTNATLQLDHANALGSNAVVSLLSNGGASKGTINLNFSGATQMVYRLFFDGVSQRKGVTWGSPTSLAEYKSDFFTGDGVIMAGELSIANLAASEVTTTSATFNGQLWANGSGPVSVCVLWGATNDGGQTWNWANTNWFEGTSWTNNQPFSTNITGLSPNTVYWYTYAVTNSSTTVFATPSVSWGGTDGQIYVSTNGTQSGSPVGTTWYTAYTNLQDALDFSAGRTQPTIIYLAGGQTLSTPTNGYDTTSLYVLQNATNVTLSGGWDTAAAPPTSRIGNTELKRLASSGNRRVLRMSGVSNAVIEQVTIRDGSVTGARGGGVYFTNCLDVTLSGCVISNNVVNGSSATDLGGGLCADKGCRLVLTNSTVVDNRGGTASGTGRCYGGGIIVMNGGRVTVVRSLIARNRTEPGGNSNTRGGGGFAVDGGGVLELYETVLNANTNSPSGATTGSGGAGNNFGTLLMRNCLVSDNYDKNAGVGLALQGGAATIINCTFVTNGTYGVKWVAGTVAMTNCIVRGHTTADLQSVPLGNVWSSGIGDGQNDGVQGCTSVDPLFVDTTYYHLQSTAGNYTNGYFTGGGWGASAGHSTLIDLGDASPYGREPAPNGDRINMGYDGNTEVASLSQTLAASPPTVTNLGALYWGHRTATLQGKVLDPGSPNPQGFFRYWPVGGATTETARAEQTATFSVLLTGLTPGQSYEYVAVASNSSGEVVSDVKSFATHPASSYLYVATNGNDTAGTNWVTAYSTVQKALNLAETNDTIYLAGHTFAGGTDPAANPHPNNAFLIWRDATNITMRGGYDAVSGGGSDPGARCGTTTVQRTGVTLVRVLSMINVTNSTVEQVRFKGGSGDVVGGGVGLYLTNCASVVFASCSIVNNTALGGSARKGVGMYLQQSSVVMTNCTVADNQQTGDNQWSGGGGVYVEAGSSLTAIRSFLVRNLSSYGGGGGFYNAGALSLFETVVASNSVASTDNGAGGYNSGTLLMRNCLVVANDCTGTGGGDGLYLAGGGAATIVNCTIVTNSASGIQWAGGTVGVTNCIVWGHSAADATNFPASVGGVLSNVAYSCFGKVVNGSGVDTTAAMAGDYDNSHCITNNPLFADAATSNFRLQSRPTPSPCINAGFNDLSWMTSGKDLDGQPRILNATVDMGAYENAVPSKGTVIVLR